SKNIRIHLSGNGGDFIVSNGSGYYIELLYNLKFKKLFKEIQSSNNSIFNEFLTKVIFPLIPEKIKILLNPIWYKFQNKFSKESLILFAEPLNFINKEFENKTKNKVNMTYNTWQPKKKSLEAKKTHYNAIFKIPEQETFEMINKMDSHFNLESRFPYFDIRLIEFCYSIPTEMKLRSGWNRYIQRASMKNILPNEIQWRVGKGTFIHYLNLNIKSKKTEVEKLVCSSNKEIANYIDLKSIKLVYEKYQQNDIIAYIHTYQIWKALIFEKWIKYLNKYN
ncbi:MAG: asparagine synthase-related protein, partial [Methanobacteriaceae archaeon]|nr:asparagine synthase-related protein [Methanobacteriaceae archaeon]